MFSQRFKGQFRKYILTTERIYSSEIYGNKNHEDVGKEVILGAISFGCASGGFFGFIHAIEKEKEQRAYAKNVLAPPNIRWEMLIRDSIIGGVCGALITGCIAIKWTSKINNLAFLLKRPKP